MAKERPHWGHISKESLHDPYQAVESYCVEIDPKHDVEHLFKEGEQFATASDALDHELTAFKEAVSKVSLLSLVLLWSRRAEKDRVLGQRNLKMMRELLTSGLLPLFSVKKLSIVSDLVAINHEIIIAEIRCYYQWPIQKREDFVLFYLEFANWLSSSTYGYVSNAIDPDRKFTARRQLQYDEFIKLLTYLPERERILSKLFYLGGERGLEEVISLKMEDIDFQTGQIHFEKCFIHYPKHVVSDIKEYVGSKRKGFVFTNKSGDKINHTVPYRALKSAAEKLNLPSTFTFKDLIKEF